MTEITPEKRIADEINVMSAVLMTLKGLRE